MGENKENNIYAVGIDIGSTTVKIVIKDSEENVVFAKYERHFAEVRDTVMRMLTGFFDEYGDIECTMAITGSGGLQLAEYAKLNFVQEVIAVTLATKNKIPQADVAVELGGEDAKIIYFTNGVEQRMNGICAGGTGAFIDQMAALLQTDATGLNEYAKGYKEIYPIAARCGVFAKTDIQPLINDGALKEDLAASIFQAVTNQTISGLACGRRIRGNVVFLGGPLYFLSELQKAFTRTLKLDDEHAFFPENAHLFAAEGTAIASKKFDAEKLSSIIDRMGKIEKLSSMGDALQPLFESEEDYQKFVDRQSMHLVPTASLESYEGDIFLGIDAGSTTTKLTTISSDGKLLYSFYSSNHGDPIAVAKKALAEIYERMNPLAKIAYTCSTGYGEELLKNALKLDMGEVETVAHYSAAKYFDPDVDCILDIGGQDMKCMKIKDGSIDEILLNEACSSGCGSFIESFANSLGYSAPEFAKIAVQSKNPVDLGTRCTVFMNSNVKQAQKDGAEVSDIAAGLAYSVIKNALFKVIKLTDSASLGKNVVVQGGTFMNDAVLRSFEIISGREVVRPTIAGLMGAFGAALLAKEAYESETETCVSTMLSRDEIADLSYRTENAHCKGCENHCRLTINIFSDNRRFISGNRCERGLGASEKKASMPNMFEYKKKRIFDYEPLAIEDAPRGEIGIPRVLNMYEDYPFWASFFKKLGFRVVLSPFSSRKIFERGMDSIPSESECYPAKLVHGHIEWLIDHGVETIFYPCVYYERKEDKSAQNHYNCPMVISYPENIKNNVDSLKEKNVRFLDPFVAFTNEKILTERLEKVMEEEFGIGKSEVAAAVHTGWKELMNFRADIEKEGEKILDWVEKNDKAAIVVAGRPYHIDPEVNHGIPDMIQSYGFAVLTEDSIAHLGRKKSKIRTTNQWTYHARLYAAARYVSKKHNLNLIQLNSFGCGVDAVTVDQVHEILSQAGKIYTLLKIDEVNNLGAAKIRVRSLIAALASRRKQQSEKLNEVEDYQRVVFSKDMKGYTLLCTQMSTFHFDFLEAAMRANGCKLEMLRNESRDVTDMGLKFVNNDACYPAMIVTGQALEAVLSGRYDTDKLAIVMVQTGGGCRASNYVAFIRKALSDAGYGHIPVISVSPNLMESNPGFKYTFKMGFKCLQALVYGDLLMKVTYKVRPYEKEKGSTNALYEKWKKECLDDLNASRVNNKKFRRNCRQIIEEFDNLPQHEDLEIPRVGIVGEVLVKFMPIANNHLAEALEREGVEVVMPDFIEFLQYCFSNSIYRHKYLGDSGVFAKIAQIANWLLDKARKNMFEGLEKSKHFKIPEKLEKIKEDATKVLQEGNQCGEGWFLPGEIIDLIKNKVNNIVCVQPFGCLPNHIAGKGTIKKIRELYPESNIVAIDYDPSASEVNQLNRIKLMLENAKINMCSE